MVGLGLWAQAGAPAPRGGPAAERAPAARGDVLEAAPVRIEFRNDFQRGWKLVELRAILDGREVAQVTAPEGGELDERLVLFDGPLPPQQLALSVVATLVGRNRGIFNYLDEYQVNLDALSPVTPARGRGGTLTVVLDRQRGATVPVERQATLRFEPDAALAAAGNVPAADPRPAVGGGAGAGR
jgi:hypothetical protein